MSRWRATAAGAATILAVAIGVEIAREESVYSHPRITTTVTFQREISRIFQRKCYQCHADGSLAMPLTTYREARPWAAAIKEEILERRMPPWGAVAGYGHFVNDMSLTSREVSLILSWADGGAPSGVLLAEESLQPVMVPPLSGWEHGDPDAIVPVAADARVPAGSGLTTVAVEVPTGLSRPSAVRLMQLNFADRRAVRYAAVYEARTRRWLGTWTPSRQVMSWGEGVALPLPANQTLSIEIGYRGASEEAAGGAELGLYFSKERLPEMSTVQIAGKPLSVPAGQRATRVRSEHALKTATALTALWAELGPGGQSLEVTAYRPDGQVTPLVWVNRYRRDFPSSYVLKAPLTLPAGTRLVATSYFDNATDAVMQVSPTVWVSARPPAPPAATRGR